MGLTDGVEILSFYTRIGGFVLPQPLGGFLRLVRAFADVFVEEGLSGPFVLPSVFFGLIKRTILQQMQSSLLLVGHEGGDGSLEEGDPPKEVQNIELLDHFLPAVVV